MCYRQIWNKHFGKNKLFRRRLSKSTFPFDCDTLKKKTLSFRIDLLNYYFYGISGSKIARSSRGDKIYSPIRNSVERKYCVYTRPLISIRIIRISTIIENRPKDGRAN